MKLGQEQIIQITVMDFCRYHNLDKFIFYCPNERKCSAQHGAILKRMGVKAGVSDLIIARQSNGYAGMYLELKATNGKLSKNQSEFLHDMQEEGYKTAIAWSADEAIKTICDYLNLDITHPCITSHQPEHQ